MANWVNIFPPAIVALVLVIAFVLGAVFASFIGCVAWRRVAGENPWRGRSHCDGCNRVLSALDLIPIVGWLACKGRCAQCGCKVSARGPVTEALLGIVFVLVILRFGLGVPAIMYCALAVILLGLSLVDLDSMTIPNAFIIAAIVVWVLGVAASAVAPASSLVAAPAVTNQVAAIGAAQSQAFLGQLVEGALGAIVMGVLLLLFSMAFEKVTGKVGFGGGDVKLIFAAGLYIGLPLSVFSIIVSCILGLVIAAVLQRKTADGKSAPFPFGPAIAAATMVTILVGPAFLGWYLALFL